MLASGHARLGDNWQEQDLVAFGGTRFHSPTLEMKRIFDLMDRGFDPQGAIDWMHAKKIADLDRQLSLCF